MSEKKAGASSLEPGCTKDQGSEREKEKGGLSCTMPYSSKGAGQSRVDLCNWLMEDKVLVLAKSNAQTRTNRLGQDYYYYLNHVGVGLNFRSTVAEDSGKRQKSKGKRQKAKGSRRRDNFVRIEKDGSKEKKEDVCCCIALPEK